MKSWFALSVLWYLGGFTRDDLMLVHGVDTCSGGILRLQDMIRIDYQVDVTGGCRIFVEPYVTDGLDWAELSFSTFDLTSGEVAIYDAQSGGNQLWYCIGCSSNLPSPIRSDTGVFYVRVSASSAGTNDITLSYFGVNVNSLATQDDGRLSSNDYTYNYVMPFGVVMAPTYGGTDASPSGTLAYNLDWRWHIKPTGSDEKVILMVTDVGLYPGSSDTVTVYDGNSKTSTVLATFTSATTSVNEWVMSTGNQLLVVLDTTGRTSSVAGSFRARYMTRGSTNAVSQGDYSYCGYAGGVDGIVDFRGDSMIITDGSATNSPQKVSDTCRWSISPSIAQSAAYTGSEDRATLVMSMVSMGTASMSVYDGQNGVGARLLWYCSKCTEVVPPPLISTTGHYYMEYSTASVVSGLGFEAKYFTNWENGMGFGDREVYLRMGTATSVRPPSFSRKYPASLEHVWWIKPNNVVAGTSIYVILNRVDLSGRNDNLTIYDGKWSVGDGAGTVIARYTGSNYPTKWIVAPSSTRTLTAHFATDDGTTHNGIGFDLGFFSDSNNYQCGGHVINPGVLSAPSFIFTDGSDSETTVYPSMDCEWLIRPKGSSTSEVSRIDLFFDRMDMAGGTLSVYEGSSAGGSLLWYCDGCAIVPSIISTTNSTLLVKMQTSGTAGSYGLGFRATYYSIYDGAIGPGDGRVTLMAGAAPLVESPSFSASYGALGDTEDRSLPNHLDLEYLIPSKTGRISLSFVDMWFQDNDCGDNVTIYDGITRSARVLASYCASTPPMDWVVSNNTAHALLIVLRTDGDGSRVGGFSFAYFSDTAVDGCGHLSEPGLMVAPSMTFNDGSFSTSVMRRNEYCEWRIEPQSFEGGEVTLQFNRVALQGANLTVFDTTIDRGASLLWRCDGCSDIPPVLVSNKSLVVVLKTGASMLSAGFEAHYATTRGLGRGEYRSTPGGRPQTWQGSDGESVLRMPVFSDVNAETPFWHLSVPVANQQQRLSFGAGIGTTCLRSQLDDGSVANGRLRSTLAFPRPEICGVYETGGAAASLVTEQSSYFERQRNPRLYWAEKRQPQCSRFQNLSGVLNYDRSQSRLDQNETLFASHQDCHWVFTPSQPAKKLVIHFDELQAHEDFYIKVYAGTSSRGQVLLNCQGCDLSGKRVTSTCGSLYVRHERNSTDIIATGSNVTGAVFKAKVFYRKGDPEGLCLDDPLWKPVKKKKEKITVLQIAVWGMLGIMAMVVVGVPFYFLVGRRYLYPNTFEQEEVVKKFRMVSSAVQRHPFYTPRLDQMRNYFLRPNECTICYTEEKAFVFECKHSICFDCTQNYMASALGDVSMFPLKCPMHHTGCLVTIGPDIAKRVLSKEEYARFCSFLDRAVLGEGLNCLKCNLFVNLPENASNPMVQCPYCRHRFCHRCKTDWHTGMRCEDRPDQELEEWRKSKGAMKCPGCYKIIEKDDPDTCNHMVHKATDGMPCLRDRTDFCYCCGMEVLPDYPHEELGTGINHFPDGVFNDCRVVNDGYAVALMQRTNERAAGRGRGRGRNRSRIGRRSAPAANAVYPEIELDDLTHYFN